MSAAPGSVSLSTPQSNNFAGDLVPVTADFLNGAGAPTSPTSVTLKYSQSGTTLVTTMTTGQLTVVGTGVFAFNIDTTGFPLCQVLYEFEGTGAVQANGESYFWVTPLPF